MQLGGKEIVILLDRVARESLTASCITALSVLPSLWAISSTSPASLGGSEIVFWTTGVVMLSHQPLSKNDSYHAKAARETDCSEELLLRNRTQRWATPSRPGEFHPEPLTEPDVSLSTYPARATHRRLPPSAKTNRVHPAEQLTQNGSRRE